MTTKTSFERPLSKGEKIIYESGQCIYDYGDTDTIPYVYYIMAGMVRIEHKLPDDSNHAHYQPSATIFGLEEANETQRRISRVTAIEKTMLFRWKVADYFANASDNRKLAILSIRSLSRQLRILNAEYGELTARHKEELSTSSEEDQLRNRGLRLDGQSIITNHPHLRHTFSDKQIIIREGEIQRQIYWILNGEVYVTRTDKGEQTLLATLGKGELIGEMSFFDASLPSANVIAHGDVQVLAFSTEDFKEIFFTNSKWVKRLIISLSARTIHMIEKVAKLRSIVTA